MVDDILDITRSVISSCDCPIITVNSIRYDYEFKTIVINTTNHQCIVCWNVSYPDQCTDVFDDDDRIGMVKKYIGIHKFTQKKVAWIINSSQSNISLIMKKYGIERDN